MKIILNNLSCNPKGFVFSNKISRPSWYPQDFLPIFGKDSRTFEHNEFYYDEHDEPWIGFPNAPYNVLMSQPVENDGLKTEHAYHSRDIIGVGYTEPSPSTRDTNGLDCFNANRPEDDLFNVNSLPSLFKALGNTRNEWFEGPVELSKSYIKGVSDFYPYQGFYDWKPVVYENDVVNYQCSADYTDDILIMSPSDCPRTIQYLTSTLGHSNFSLLQSKLDGCYLNFTGDPANITTWEGYYAFSFRNNWLVYDHKNRVYKHLQSLKEFTLSAINKNSSFYEFWKLFISSKQRPIWDTCVDYIDKFSISNYTTKGITNCVFSQGTDSIDQKFDKIQRTFDKFIHPGHGDAWTPTTACNPSKLDQRRIFGELALVAAQERKFIDMDVLTFLAEIKSIRGIPKILMDIRLIFNSVKDLANSYLAVKYGILPLVGELGSIIDAYVSERFSDKEAYRAATYYEGEFNNFYIQTSYNYKLTTYPFSTRTLSSLYDLLSRMGLSNILGTLWELTPFSFVVDWFFATGDVINNLDEKLSTASIPMRSSLGSVTTLVPWNQTNYKPYGVTSGKIFTREYQRMPFSQVPLPMLPDKYWKGNFPANHTIEASALVYQAMSGK